MAWEKQADEYNPLFSEFTRYLEKKLKNSRISFRMHSKESMSMSFFFHL